MAVQISSGIDHPQLLVLLADGQLHSGECLARRLGVSRAAVWKGVERLRRFGIGVQASARRGYQLAQAVELLDARRIGESLCKEGARRLQQVELLFAVDSTSNRLLAGDPPPYGCAHACLSELQTAGRGRRGRRWIAPFGGSITMSVGWSFRDSARVLPSLSLSVGVAIARALARVGARDVKLKWPNDIWFDDRKLGGVLIELKAEAGGPAYVVIGVGINLWMNATTRRAIEAMGVRVACVSEVCPIPPARNRLVGILLDEILSVLMSFETTGFAPLRQAWEALDTLRGRAAEVLVGERVIAGTACGVDEEGALLLRVGECTHKFVSGEVSLRLSKEVN